MLFDLRNSAPGARTPAKSITAGRVFMLRYVWGGSLWMAKAYRVTDRSADTHAPADKATGAHARFLDDRGMPIDRSIDTHADACREGGRCIVCVRWG